MHWDKDAGHGDSGCANQPRPPPPAPIPPAAHCPGATAGQLEDKHPLQSTVQAPQQGLDRRSIHFVNVVMRVIFFCSKCG